MTRYKRAPLGSAILGGLFRDHLVSRAASVQPHTPKPNVSSSPQPIPLGEVGLRRFCETRGGGGVKGLFATRNFLT